MTKVMIALAVLLSAQAAFAGPIVEVFICELNEGKTIEDVNKMMGTFKAMTDKAGIADSYTAHVGFQQVPIKTNSVNWIGIAPSAQDYGKAIDWFTGTADGIKFAALYSSIYTCDNSFMTFITASSK